MVPTQILLVDDNPVQADARRAILTRIGANVLVASDGAEALALLENETLRATVALMVTDHLMPGIHGPELVERTRLLLPGLPILVLSGLPEAESFYGGLHVLFRLKPFPPAELIRLVTNMLGDRALRSA